MTDPNLINVYDTMRQSENLMHDHAWNGDKQAYESMKRRYIKLKALYDAGIEFCPLF